MSRTSLATSHTTAVLALALALAFAGCGGAYQAQPSTLEEEPEGSAADYAARIDRLERELNAELDGGNGEPEELGTPAPAQPDCRAAPELRDRICELAERVCRIAERDRADASVAQTCAQARDTCQRAREQVSRACGG